MGCVYGGEGGGWLPRRLCDLSLVTVCLGVPQEEVRLGGRLVCLPKRLHSTGVERTEGERERSEHSYTTSTALLRRTLRSKS